MSPIIVYHFVLNLVYFWLPYWDKWIYCVFSWHLNFEMSPSHFIKNLKWAYKIISMEPFLQRIDMVPIFLSQNICLFWSLFLALCPFLSIIVQTIGLCLQMPWGCKWNNLPQNESSNALADYLMTLSVWTSG